MKNRKQKPARNRTIPHMRSANGKVYVTAKDKDLLMADNTSAASSRCERRLRTSVDKRRENIIDPTMAMIEMYVHTVEALSLPGSSFPTPGIDKA